MAIDMTQMNTSNSFDGCIGFIGAGVMGTALIKSLLSIGINANQICISEKVAEKSQELHRTLGVTEKSIAEIAIQCDLIFLAVKPQDLGDLLSQLSKSLPEKTLLLSIAAGKTTAFIEAGIGKANPVIRIMPNTPAQVGKGVCAKIRACVREKRAGRVHCNLPSPRLEQPSPSIEGGRKRLVAPLTDRLLDALLAITRRCGRRRLHLLLQPSHIRL
jgi:ketopantoate reductase